MIGLSATAGVPVAIAFAGAAGFLWFRLRRRALLLGVARHVTRDHARLLSVKRNQLVAHDGYGNYRLQPWIDHVDYFIGARHPARSATARPQDRRRDKGYGAVVAHQESLAADAAGRGGRSGRCRFVNADVVSGEHYEALCRTLLQGRGWKVETTPMTGDQGADLIAEAHGRRVVIQCKFHARPIGNKAVQEAFAAVGFHGGDAAVVVSNASFTRSARQLAEANGVFLLHHEQLPDLERMVRQAKRKA